MLQNIHNDTVPIINLMGIDDRAPAAPAAATVVDQPVSAPVDRMTLADLQANYSHIIASRSLYYPVAYQFLRELGRGRQGIVMLGLRQGARGCITEHAIKLYDPSLYRSPEEYWTDMGRIASQVSHLQRVQSPNLVMRHAYEETYGIGYLQMEAIDGLDLAQLLGGSHLELARRHSTPQEWFGFSHTIFRVTDQGIRLQPGVAVYVLRRVLRGLETLHAKNFLHTDIKPANIMIDRMGSPKIVDFGRAVRIGERLSFLFGSPMYMAPELHRGDMSTPQCDLYSAGLVALEMLRGRRLVDQPDASTETLLAAKRDLPERLPHLLPHDVAANEALVGILRRLLAPDPAHRYHEAKEAEIGSDGLSVVHKQLVYAGLDSEYGRDLEAYISKLVDKRTQRVESSALEP